MAVDLLLCNTYRLRDDPVSAQAMDIYPLLGHGYLASYLEAHGFRVAEVDLTFAPDDRPFLDALDSLKPRAVGFYGHILTRHRVFELARLAGQQGAFVLAGGPDATGYHEDYLRHGVDLVVRGEGEETTREVMEWLRAGARPEERERIQGIAFRENGHARVTPMRPFIKDVDALPFPRRDPEIYRPYLEAWRTRHGYVSLAIFGARGCPFDCAFCYRPVFGRAYRRRSPANIVAEIEECVRRFGAEHFRFVDDTFVVHRPWVEELARLIRQRGLRLTFDVLARTDLVDDRTASILREMGVRRVYFGMESGSDRVLQRMSKRLSVEDHLRAVEAVRRHGLEFLSWIMLGYPGEEWEDILRTRDLLVRVKPDILSISIAFPIKGTAFYEEVRDRISRKRPFWRRTGENRLVWRGRYPNVFYVLARRWLALQVALARGEVPPWRRPLAWAGIALARLGMEVLRRRPFAGPPFPERPSIPLRQDNLSNRTRGGLPYA